MTLVDLDLCYVKFKFGYIGFSMGESEIYFLETIAALGLKSLKHSAKQVNEVE